MKGLGCCLRNVGLNWINMEKSCHTRVTFYCGGSEILVQYFTSPPIVGDSVKIGRIYYDVISRIYRPTLENGALCDVLEVEIKEQS